MDRRTFIGSVIGTLVATQTPWIATAVVAQPEQKGLSTVLILPDTKLRIQGPPIKGLIEYTKRKRVDVLLADVQIEARSNTWAQLLFSQVGLVDKNLKCLYVAQIRSVGHDSSGSYSVIFSIERAVLNRNKYLSEQLDQTEMDSRSTA